ncbi:FMN-binding protein [Sedimentibacter hydroxybenzoicus DSM 7310]|uniref:FMN-binding protein n=2 Tax=Sedimentibacter hydroxybenzoicus TaxID=29345 RepID=A0A974GV50_SEDHY|nr:FMN-binding protein [Sedimentibacter hydroxybenzoicus DSM 7310]
MEGYMKKLALIISFLMLFSMAACTDNNNNPGTNNPDTNNPGTNTPGEETPGNGENNLNGNTGVDLPENGDLGGDTETLKGSAQGYGGEVTVTVMVNGEDIVSVEVMGEKETPGVGTNAIEQLPEKIEEADSTDVEAISGATVTSNAIKEAVDKALEGRK